MVQGKWRLENMRELFKSKSMYFKSFVIMLLVASFAFSMLPIYAGRSKLSTADYGDIRDTMSDTWVAVDELGRWVATGDDEGTHAIEEDKHVLMFYYTWHSGLQGPYNIRKILDKYAETGRAVWGGKWQFHYWDEPYFGYYKSDDPWVIRKDIQMLCDAGVDGVFFDAGNGYLYHAAYEAFFAENQKRKDDGQSYLKATWMICAGGPKGSVGNVLKELYDVYYTDDKYKDVLYEVDGKPLILAPDSAMNSEFNKFFTQRYCWAWKTGENRWPWLDEDGEGGWGPDSSADKLEQMSVAAAGHPTQNIGKSFSMAYGQPSDSEFETEKGIRFIEQWERAIEADPQFVLVTQWNEWIAQRFITGEDGGSQQQGNHYTKNGESYFVDVYTAEYSRDIAPMKNTDGKGYGDNYYYLLANYVRLFKGAREIPTYKTSSTVDINNFATINQAEAIFYDDLYDTLHRDHPTSVGASKKRLVDDSGRNDFEEVRVASDDNNVYFYIKTVEDITAPEGTNWMNILINSDSDYTTGWHGYDYVVNRSVNGNTTSIDSYGADGTYAFTSAGSGSINYSGKEMVVSVPKSVINVSGNKFTIDFKIADNIPEEDYIMYFIDKGDVAPNNRFNYRYKFDVDYVAKSEKKGGCGSSSAVFSVFAVMGLAVLLKSKKRR